MSHFEYAMRYPHLLNLKIASLLFFNPRLNAALLKKGIHRTDIIKFELFKRQSKSLYWIQIMSPDKETSKWINLFSGDQIIALVKIEYSINIIKKTISEGIIMSNAEHKKFEEWQAIKGK